MNRYVALCIAKLLFIPTAMAVDQNLIGKTLICQQVGQQEWRGMTYIYVTATHMFRQHATKNMKTGEIDGGGSSEGAVYQWNKRTSGKAGVVTFRTYATKGVGKLSYETRYRVPNTLSDNITMDVVEKGLAELQGSNWTLVVDRWQSSPDGPVLVPHIRESQRCRVKDGRHLL